MMETWLQKIIQAIFMSKVRQAERKIGYRLKFNNIPASFINGYVSWDETTTWKAAGINLQTGVNYWTIGKIIDGDSSRYERNTPEYQAWFGGYLVKLAGSQAWTVEDHFKLAIADQDSWLKTDGDPNPRTNIDGWKFSPIGQINLGRYAGTLYEGGCNSQSDISKGYNSVWLRLVSMGIAALFNASNPNLHLGGYEVRPEKIGSSSYENLKLHGYIAIFDLEGSVKVVLYANGTIYKDSMGKEVDTFKTLNQELLAGIKSVEIVKIQLARNEK